MNTNIEVVTYGSDKEDFRNSSRYDEIRYRGAANEYKAIVTSNALMSLIGNISSKRILDVGCGTGRGLLDVCSSAAFSIGADASRDMLKLAAQKVPTNTRTALVQCYAQQLPFADEAFDAVICLNCLHLFKIETQAAMITEMKRVVRHGGVIILEFDNALCGVFLGICNRWLGRVRGSTPSEIRSIIGSDCRVVRKYGAIYPVIWRVFHHFPKIFIPLEKLAYYWPLNYLGYRIFYELHNEAGSPGSRLQLSAKPATDC